MPPSAIIAEVVWCVCLVIYLVIRIPPLGRARKVAVRSSRREAWDWIIRAVGTLGLGILPLLYVITKFPRFATYPFFPPFAIVGSAMFALALWCIYRSLHDLGRAFSPSLEIRDRHQLVTAGIYRHIRHPMYLGFLLWAIAQLLLLPNWVVGAAGLAGWTVFFVSRVGREERMLLDEFGNQYEEYIARTYRVLPGLF
ncbi:MAG TPA: protein-S-isoprenylcysteine O-methyltransferase [Xanthobacteraceae bacterium]